MAKHVVSVVPYEKPRDSVARCVAEAGGFDRIPAGSKVFIKPNIVFWTKAVVFPKWGVITTSRVIEDVVRLLKDQGVDDITIGEGVVVGDPKDTETPRHAFDYLGYTRMGEKYGVRAVNVMERPFKKVELEDGATLRFSADALESDFIIDIPAMKTHNQTVVSLGIKNLKGTIDIPSRKKCHSADPEKDLHWWVSRLADKMPPVFTLIDGIYTLERGPAFDGRVHRSNILIGSWDILSADMVGATLLGHPPETVPHLVHAAEKRGRALDLSQVEIVGEKVEPKEVPLQFDFAYSKTDEGVMPVPLAKQGIKGLYYQKYDLSMCTYCSGLNGLILSAIRAAWTGEPFDDVEVLTGKIMDPDPNRKKTILVGQCMVKKHKNNPDIQNAFPIKGCPPAADDVVQALHDAGIKADKGLFDNRDQLPGFFMARYTGKPEYEEEHFQVEDPGCCKV